MTPLSGHDQEDELEISRPQVLFEGRFQSEETSVSPGTHYDVSADGHFVMIQEEGGVSAETSFRVVLNWFEELKRLAPHPDPP